MISRLIWQIAFVGAVTSQSCLQSVENATLEYFSGEFWKWTHMDFLSLQNGETNNQKCFFMKSKIHQECLNKEGMCKNETKIVIFKNETNLEELYRRPTVNSGEDVDLVNKYGTGIMSEKNATANSSESGNPGDNFVCDLRYPYRSFDGSCNNLIYPYDGMAGTTQRRFIPSDYDDGHSAPRNLSRCDSGASLPSARLVSNIVHVADAMMDQDSSRSLLLMQLGQLLALDVVLTPMETRADGGRLDCCGVDKTNQNCFPIDIPSGDPKFVNCMHLARSEGVMANGQREQRNKQTSFVDLSMVYGVSAEESNNLRTLQGGLLKSVLNKLPRDDNDMLCQPTRPTDHLYYYCPLSGDVRFNEQPGLSAFTTIFMREHNRLAKALAQVNPTWTDEKLFQEARKINIAEWQHIVFHEYLLATLGAQAMQDHSLWVSTIGYRDTYLYKVDATIINSFSTAVFRFGHSLVPNDIKLKRLNDEVVFVKDELKNHFLKPDLYHTNNHTGMDNILKWMSNAASPLSDRKIESSVRQFLFLDSRMNSFDLVSLNIQRGRDHGLRGYNWFRYYVCGLPWAYNFGTDNGGLVDHDPDVAHLLSQVYSCPDDIDLFTGHMTERRRPGSQLGPTGECLMGFQMRRLKDGDRFFYERYDYFSGGFTPAQLSEIKKIRLSDLFCLNTADVAGKRIQRNMLLQPGPANGFIDCSAVPGINVHFWHAK